MITIYCIENMIYDIKAVSLILAIAFQSHLCLRLHINKYFKVNVLICGDCNFNNI